MIQRIQTIWLSLCTILSLFLMKGPFLRFTGKGQEICNLGFSGLTSSNGDLNRIVSGSIATPAILIIIPAVSLLAIFLYRNRNLQKITVIALIFVSAGLCFAEGYFWNLAAVKYNCLLLPGIKMAFPPVIMVFAILACLGIRKDEKIVRSYDRLR